MKSIARNNIQGKYKKFIMQHTIFVKEMVNTVIKYIPPFLCVDQIKF